MRILAFAATVTLLAGPAWSQTPPAAPQPAAPPAAAPAPDAAATPKLTLPTYVKQPDYQAEIVKAAKAQMKQAPIACGNPVFKPTGQVVLLSPVSFSGGRPYAGAWSERIEATDCGPVHAVNVLTVAHADTLPQFIAMLPGDTHTDPVMQKNALQYAQAIAVRAAPKGCQQLAFVDTKFDGFTGLPNPEITDGRESRAWHEIWTLFACGSLFDVDLTFTPNANGTALTGSNPVKHR